MPMPHIVLTAGTIRGPFRTQWDTSRWKRPWAICTPRHSVWKVRWTRFDPGFGHIAEPQPRRHARLASKRIQAAWRPSDPCAERFHPTDSDSGTAPSILPLRHAVPREGFSWPVLREFHAWARLKHLLCSHSNELLNLVQLIGDLRRNFIGFHLLRDQEIIAL